MYTFDAQQAEVDIQCSKVAVQSPCGTFAVYSARTRHFEVLIGANFTGHYEVHVRTELQVAP